MQEREEERMQGRQREIKRTCFKIYPEGEGEREWKKGIEILKEREEEEETEKVRDGQMKNKQIFIT